jgi:hypothetical protein
MYAKYDAEGNQRKLMERIIDHKMDGHVVDYAEMYIRDGINSKSGRQPRVGT